MFAVAEKSKNTTPILVLFITCLFVLQGVLLYTSWKEKSAPKSSEEQRVVSAHTQDIAVKRFQQNAGESYEIVNERLDYASREFESAGAEAFAEFEEQLQKAGSYLEETTLSFVDYFNGELEKFNQSLKSAKP